MPQGKNKKALNKRVIKGERGYPMATVAFYGPDNSRASKTVCAIIQADGADAEPIQKWTSTNDGRNSENILREVLLFIEQHGAKTVAMADGIIGCPHEEGIDYPEGEPCPKCPYWKARDRFTHERYL